MSSDPWSAAIDGLSAKQKSTLEGVCLRLVKAMTQDEPVLVMFPSESGVEMHYLSGGGWPTRDVLNDTMSALMEVSANAPSPETEQ